MIRIVSPRHRQKASVDTERDRALFPFGVRIANRESWVVLESSHGIGEVDSTLGDVLGGLGGAHSQATALVCTNVHFRPRESSEGVC